MSDRALRRGEIVRIRDERWSVRRHLRYATATVVDVRGCDRTNRGRRARFLLPFEPLQRLPAPHAIRIVSRRRWQHLARHVLAGAVPAYDSLQALASARIDILPFQLEPALAVTAGDAARVLLADDVGLGKTVQAGLIISETLTRSADARVLVICPAALRAQWADELEQRFGLRPALVDSATVARPGLRITPGGNPWSAHPLVVASVDYVKRPEALRGLEDLVWDVVVIDEAHGVAGRSDRHTAATLLGERARTLVMLTATPHSGDDEAFQRLCDIGAFGDRFPLAVFRRTRADVGLPSSRRTTWLSVKPTAAEMRMHRALVEYARLVWRRPEAAAAARLAMIVLLRRACSSAASLARSVERRLVLLSDDCGEAFQPGLPFGAAGSDDEEPGGELGVPGLANPKFERSLLENILRLARSAQGSESKLHLLDRLLRRTHERAIVFTEYRDTLVGLARELARFGCAELHGGLASTERDEILRQFVNGVPRVLLATDAASEGLNLQQRCRLVLNLEVPWTPLRLEQRVGRVDRIGQPQRVHQIVLVASKTEEESTIARLVRDRAARAGRTLAALRRPHVEERDIADGIFGLDSARATAASDLVIDLPTNVSAVALHARAAEDAARASAARALRSEAAPLDIPAGPFAAAVHPRGSRGCCAFRMCVVDDDEALLWETIIGVCYDVRDAPFHDAKQLRRHLDDVQDALVCVVRPHADLLLRRMAPMLDAATALAVAREEAIAARLAERRARLAASLLQPALFGHRAERETAAQRAVIEEAERRCREQLAKLARRERPLLQTVEPAFAVICR